MGYVFCHIDRVQRTYDRRLIRFWTALKRRALNNVSIRDWWKDLLEGDPESVYIDEKLREKLLEAIKKFAPGAHWLIENGDKFFEADSRRPDLSLQTKSPQSGAFVLSDSVRS